MRKIWSSELSAYNKHLAHNTFALPVLTLTFGILDRTIREIENLDITTRKILNMTGNFDRNSDIDRLYLPRKNGGRGLKTLQHYLSLEYQQKYQQIHHFTFRIICLCN